MKPFVILALPRSGTTLLCSSLGEHPDLPRVVHEFRGNEEKFWENPYVLSNYWQDWMSDPKIVKIHYYRANLVAAAKSQLTNSSFIIPDDCYELPILEVEKLVEKRRKWSLEFDEKADHRFSYEELTGEDDLEGQFPESVSNALCEWLDLSPHSFRVARQIGRRVKLLNDEQIECLKDSIGYLTFP